MNTIRNRLVALAAIMGVSGCEYFYLGYTDCGYYDGPRFDRTFLNQPVLNQVYFDRVKISLDDDRHIDDYGFQLQVSGVLPPGITYYQDGRDVYFEGTATSQGSYAFTVIADVRYTIRDRYYYGSYYDYCSYRTAQNYLFVVNLM